jgi:hypothetical protein
MYDLGQGLLHDTAEALRWYRTAADQGDAKAQCELGSMYYYGRGVQQDRAEAARWYRRAADRGLARAQYDLGYMYHYGQAVPQDRAEADRWYHKAADQGYESAQRALGFRGRGLSTLRAVTLAAIFLWCLSVLKDSPSPGQGLRNRQQGALTLAGLSGLAYVGMSLYRVIGVFHSVLAVNAFYFIETLVLGISVAMPVYFFSFFSPKVAKIILGISGVLLIGINLLAIPRPNFWRLALAARGLFSLDGLLLGISIPVAIFLWQTYKKSRG